MTRHLILPDPAAEQLASGGVQISKDRRGPRKVLVGRSYNNPSESLNAGTNKL
jgi:hypothetical protein